MNRSRIAEADFRLGGMNVDIYGLGDDVEKEDDRRMPFEVERIRGTVRSVRQDAVANQALVHEEKLIAAAAVAEAPGDEPSRPDSLQRAIDRLQPSLGVPAEDLDDALAMVGGGWEIEHEPPVMDQAERTRRGGKCVRGDGGDDRAELGVDAAEKLAPCRDVLEQLADRDRSSAVASAGAYLAGASQRIADDLGGMRGLPIRGQEREARDAGDGGERLTTESERAHACQIVEIADLRGRVTLEGEHGVFLAHPRSVVADLDQLSSTLLEDDVDGARSGIDG